MTEAPQYTPYDEQTLLQQIAEGNTAAFRQIFDAYRRRCFSYAYKITASVEASEDVVQEVFLRLWSIRTRLPQIENLNSYLHRMIHNQACTELERVAREGLVQHFLKTGDAFEEDPGRQLLAREVRDHIQHLVDHLSPRQREVFLLSREKGLKYDEIAARLGIGFETVKTHLSEALKVLRSGLTDRFGEQALVIILIWQLGNL